MKSFPILALILSGAVAACAPRTDPRVSAAQDFQRTAFDLIERDNQQTKRLNSLRLGMTDGDVLQTAGPPTRRQTLSGYDDEKRELWTYSGELKQLATLTFENGKLVQLQVQ